MNSQSVLFNLSIRLFSLLPKKAQLFPTINKAKMKDSPCTALTTETCVMQTIQEVTVYMNVLITVYKKITSGFFLF